VPAVEAQGPGVATAVWIRAGEADDRIQVVNYDIDASAKEADSGDGEGDDESGDTGDGEQSNGRRFTLTGVAVYQVRRAVLSGVYTAGGAIEVQKHFALHAARQSAMNLRRGA
jgi:hypothetical protein